MNSENDIVNCQGTTGENRHGTSSNIREEDVAFYSDGQLLKGVLSVPTGAQGRLPAVIQATGFLAVAQTANDARWRRAVAEAGFAVLGFDYRGFGLSEGERGWVRPDWQIEDLSNAVTFLTTREEIDPCAIGVFGKGGTGGGNAVALGGLDERVRSIVAMTPVADGSVWLRQMRREYEWNEFLSRIEDNAREVVQTGAGELVDPRTELMVVTPERAKVTYKAGNDTMVPDRFYLASAEYLLRYRPVELVGRISPRASLIIGVERDSVTPLEHAASLFEAARAPKQLVVQRDTTHYESYERNFDRVVPMIVEWYQRYMRAGAGMTAADSTRDEILYVS